MARRAPAAPDSREGGGAKRRPTAPIPPISSLDPPPNSWRRRSLRYGRRLLAVGAFAAALYVGYSYVAEPYLGDETEAAAPAQEEQGEGAPAEPADDPPPRPEAAPQQIPDWAWALNEWHSTPPAQRDERPADAPTPVPDWYWEWREWRIGGGGG